MPPAESTIPGADGKEVCDQEPPNMFPVFLLAFVGCPQSSTLPLFTRAEAERSAHFVLPRLASVFPRDNLTTSPPHGPRSELSRNSTLSFDNGVPLREGLRGKPHAPALTSSPNCWEWGHPCPVLLNVSQTEPASCNLQALGEVNSPMNSGSGPSIHSRAGTNPWMRSVLRRFNLEQIGRAHV